MISDSPFFFKSKTLTLNESGKRRSGDKSINPGSKNPHNTIWEISDDIDIGSLDLFFYFWTFDSEMEFYSYPSRVS